MAERKGQVGPERVPPAPKNQESVPPPPLQAARAASRLNVDEKADLVYVVSTWTLDLALPGDDGPRWGHLSEESSRIVATGFESWLWQRGRESAP